MIEKYLCENWDMPPEKMEFTKQFDRIVQELYASLKQVIPIKDYPKAAEDPFFYQHLSTIHLLAPALPNVTLNYKICMEFGLPVDSIRYINFDRTEKKPGMHSRREQGEARQLFREAVFAARLAYQLSPNCLSASTNFYKHLPAAVREAEFTSKKDRYTWKASDPEKINALARKIEEKIGRPDLIIGVAHGSIGPGMILANLLGSEMHLIRRSSFMREDSRPIISPSDETLFARHRTGKVLVFDEDVTEGFTFKSFTETLSPYFDCSYSAAVIRHRLAPFAPDFVGGEFSDNY